MGDNLGSGSSDSDHNHQERRNRSVFKDPTSSSCVAGQLSAMEDGDSYREQDRLLPIANVGRIMKQILPPNAKISKEAKETLQECASEFISFVTGEASDKCHKEKRKTVNGDDICWALQALGFDDYVDPMRRYLQKYREMEGDKAAGASSGGGGGGSGQGKRSSDGKRQVSDHDHFMFNSLERNDGSSSRQY